MFFSELAKEREWESIVANRKQHGDMFLTDDDFDCPNCGDTIDYNEYVNGDEAYGCPFCGEYLTPYSS